MHADEYSGGTGPQRVGPSAAQNVTYPFGYQISAQPVLTDAQVKEALEGKEFETGLLHTP